MLFLTKSIETWAVSSAARPQRLSKYKTLSQACDGGRVELQYSLMYYYTYVLKSNIDNKLYIGWTDNLQKRLAEHRSGQIQSTRSRRPIELVYYEACRDLKKAIAREKYFKTGFGRRFLKTRI